MASQPSPSSETPPREWLEEHFVLDGQITYCSMCNAIPYLFIGHGCTGIEMGRHAAKRITVPYRWEDVTPVENCDRPGDWQMLYTPESR